MSDDADRAADIVAIHTSAALANARRPSGPQATGQCLNCGEDLAHPLRWCNADCRDDWEQEERR